MLLERASRPSFPVTRPVTTPTRVRYGHRTSGKTIPSFTFVGDLQDDNTTFKSKTNDAVPELGFFVPPGATLTGVTIKDINNLIGGADSVITRGLDVVSRQIWNGGMPTLAAGVYQIEAVGTDSEGNARTTIFTMEIIQEMVEFDNSFDESFA